MAHVSDEQQKVAERPWLPLVLVAVGFLPLIYWHVGGLLIRPHYQFLVLLPVTIWLLTAGLETEDLQPVSRSEAAISLGLLAVSLLGLLFATWAWSPWVAAVSCMVAILGALLGAGGWRQIKNWFSVWIFCWILIPLPFGMDEDLIVRLRNVTTRLSSSVLDQLGVLHNSYVNVIELPGKPLFIADACSGIHSLYVLMAAALFLCMWLRRGVIHTICMMFSTFALVLVENVARIVIVALALGWQVDLSFGWKHEALGILLFCISLFFVFTTDQLLMFLLPSRIPSAINWLYEWMIGEGEGRQGRKRKKPHPASLIWRRAVLVMAIIFPVVGAAQLIRMPDNAPNLTTVLSDDFDMPELGESLLPESLTGFTRSSYRMVSRVPGDPLGQASQQWSFLKGPISAMVSVDYPYDGIHDLCVCYTQIGWKLAESRVMPLEEVQQIAPDAKGAIAVGRMSGELDGNAVLLFQLCDMQGNVDAIVKDLARGDAGQRAANRFNAFGEAEPTTNVGTLAGPPYVQTQVLARSSGEFTQADIEDLIRLFCASQNVLHAKTLQFSSAAEDK